MTTSMSAAAVLASLQAYVRTVDRLGDEDIRFDGLRLLSDPTRLSLVLQGRWLEVPPVTVEVWPSLSCDARCPLCPYRRSGARDKADSISAEHSLLDAAAIAEVFQQYAEAGVRSVILTGGGEPLLHPKLASIARSAVEAGMAWALFTNGSQLTETVSHELLELTPRFLRISLDAGSGQEHNRIFKLGSTGWETVVDNLYSASRVARAIGSTAFGASFTLLPTVKDEELDAMVQLSLRAAEQGVSYLTFRPRLNHFSRGTARPRSTYKSLYDRIEEAFAPLLEHGVRLDLKRALYLMADQPHSLALPPVFGTAFVTTLTDRLQMYVVNEMAGVTGSIGSVVKARFQDLWNGPLRVAETQRASAGEIYMPRINRTTPIAEFVAGLTQAMPQPLTASEADSISREIAATKLLNFSSTNLDFV